MTSSTKTLAVVASWITSSKLRGFSFSNILMIWRKQANSDKVNAEGREGALGRNSWSVKVASIRLLGISR